MPRYTTVEWLKATIFGINSNEHTLQGKRIEEVQEELTQSRKKIRDLEISRDQFESKLLEADIRFSLLTSLVEELIGQFNTAVPSLKRDLKRISSDLHSAENDIRCHSLDLQLDAELIDNIVFDIIYLQTGVKRN